MTKPDIEVIFEDGNRALLPSSTECWDALCPAPIRKLFNMRELDSEEERRSRSTIGVEQQEKNRVGRVIRSSPGFRDTGFAGVKIESKDEQLSRLGNCQRVPTSLVSAQTPVVLMRAGRGEELELAAATDYFEVYDSRVKVPPKSLVVGRYSVLPMYHELVADLAESGARLINTLDQHRYVADLGNYVSDLREMTPVTWDKLHEIPEKGPFVLKGAINSKKFQWRTHMFAETREEAFEVYGRLTEDGLIGEQAIYIRQYVPLVTYYTDLVGLPVTKEFRFFVCHGEILCGAFYWSSHTDEVERMVGVPQETEVPRDFLQKAIRRIGDSVAFYALDVAQTQSGEWIVIEINDGQMSGLSENDPGELYRSLWIKLEKKDRSGGVERS